MSDRQCVNCHEVLPEDAFRKGRKDCTWCQFDSKEKRAIERFKDKVRSAGPRLAIDRDAFVHWYLSQPDQCYYCGTGREEFKRLRDRRGPKSGYYVSWDIDRKDSKLPYQIGNLALSCYMCNMAKASYFTEDEAKIIGAAIRSVIEGRLAAMLAER